MFPMTPVILQYMFNTSICVSSFLIQYVSNSDIYYGSIQFHYNIECPPSSSCAWDCRCGCCWISCCMEYRVECFCNQVWIIFLTGWDIGSMMYGPFWKCVWINQHTHYFKLKYHTFKICTFFTVYNKFKKSMDWLQTIFALSCVQNKVCSTFK